VALVVVVMVAVLIKMVLRQLQTQVVVAVVLDKIVGHGQEATVALVLSSSVILIVLLPPQVQQDRQQSQSLAAIEFTNGLHQVQLLSKEKKCRTLQKLKMELLRK
jgi:hypothetical protein